MKMKQLTKGERIENILITHVEKVRDIRGIGLSHHSSVGYAIECLVIDYFRERHTQSILNLLDAGESYNQVRTNDIHTALEKIYPIG